jgi:hypothetical protein
MRAPLLRMLLAAALLLASGPIPASAQFGFPGVPGMRRIMPVPVPGRGLGRALFPAMPFGRMHRTFGIIGAVVVGGVILNRLSRRDGMEVTRRTRAMLDRDRDREVVETYQTKDGGNRVTITAAPAQRVSDIKDDPLLKQTADTAQQASAEAQKQAKGKKDVKLESEFLKVDALPPDTQCRKVTTELEVAPKKGTKETSDAKSSNSSILCEKSAGDWKPAST